MNKSEVDLKKTVNLPRTDFPMKANLPQNEPKLLARWEQEDIYGRIRKSRAGAPKYILHDGPPYANGNIHLGHGPSRSPARNHTTASARPSTPRFIRRSSMSPEPS